MASAIYSRMQGIRKAKYSGGRATKPSRVPSGVKGMRVRAVMPASVTSVSGAEARLWIKGSLGVRIMWMTSVWLHMDSTNHPAWNMPR